MRSFWLTTLLLVVSLVGCSHQGTHDCGPSCCSACCDAQDSTAAPLREGLSAAQWAERMDGSDAWTRQEVVLQLAAFGPTSLCYANRWLDSADGGVACSGAELARLLGPSATSTIPQLIKLLSHDQPSIRITALRALAAMPRDQLASAIADVGSSLDAYEWEVRYQAAQTLQHAGYHSHTELDHLGHRAHHDLDARVRAACAAAELAIHRDWVFRIKLLRGA